MDLDQLLSKSYNQREEHFAIFIEQIKKNLLCHDKELAMELAIFHTILNRSTVDCMFVLFVRLFYGSRCIEKACDRMVLYCFLCSKNLAWSAIIDRKCVTNRL